MTKHFRPQNQGEGDRESARRYNEKVAEHAHSGRSEQAAEQARDDLEGPEGEALRRAEKEGKKHIAEEDPEVGCVHDRLHDEDRDIVK